MVYAKFGLNQIRKYILFGNEDDDDAGHRNHCCMI